MCEKTKKKKTKKNNRNFGCLYLGNGLSDFLQIWNVDSPSWRATLQLIWFQSDKVSPRYKGVKMTFSFFLSIYSQCGVSASWAARHTIVCLDGLLLLCFTWHTGVRIMEVLHCIQNSYDMFKLYMSSNLLGL